MASFSCGKLVKTFSLTFKSLRVTLLVGGKRLAVNMSSALSFLKPYRELS